VKGLQKPWFLKRTCLLQWRKTSSSKTVQKAPAHHHRNICLEHQGSKTAAGSKCVDSHPLRAWDPWLWNKSHLYGIDKGATLMKYKVACDFSEQVSVFDTPSVWQQERMLWHVCLLLTVIFGIFCHSCTWALCSVSD